MTRRRRRTRSRWRSRWRRPVCYCDAYHFPHRTGGGRCYRDLSFYRKTAKPKSPLEQLAECSRVVYPLDEHVDKARIVAKIFREHGLKTRVVRCLKQPSYVAVYATGEVIEGLPDAVDAAKEVISEWPNYDVHWD